MYGSGYGCWMCHEKSRISNDRVFAFQWNKYKHKGTQRRDLKPWGRCENHWWCVEWCCCTMRWWSRCSSITGDCPTDVRMWIRVIFRVDLSCLWNNSGDRRWAKNERYEADKYARSTKKFKTPSCPFFTKHPQNEADAIWPVYARVGFDFNTVTLSRLLCASNSYGKSSATWNRCGLYHRCEIHFSYLFSSVAL